MDAMEKLTWDSEIAVGVLGKGGQYVLVPLGEPGPIPAEVLEDAARRGFKFCGVLAVLHGRAAVHCEPDIEAAGVMMLAAIGFAGQVADKIKQEQKGDGVCWLENLWNLTDPRES